MSGELNRRIRTSGLYLLLQKMITPVLTFAVSIYIVRTLTVDEFGIFNLFFAILAYIGLFSSLGLLNIFKRFIPEWRHSGMHGMLKKLVVYGLSLRGILALIILAAIILLSPSFSQLFQIADHMHLFMLFALGILFFLESQLLGLALASLFLHKYYAFAQIAYAVIRSLFVFVLLEAGYALKGLIIAEVVGFFVLMFFQGYWYFKYYAVKFHTPAAEDFPFKRLIRYGGYAYFNEMGEQVLDVSTDFFIISAFLGSQMLGLYAFAAETIKIITRWMPHKFFLDIISPAFFTKFAESGKLEDIRWMFSFLTKLVFFFYIPFAFVIFLLGKEIIIHIYDIKYLEALTVLWIITFFSGVNAIEVPLSLVVQAMERVEIHLQSKIFSVYNLLGNLLVIRPFGITGIALVTCSAVLFKNTFTFWRIKKTTNIIIPFKSLAIMLGNSILACIPAFLFRSGISTLWHLFGLLASAGVLYLAVSAITRPFHQDERDLINSILGKNIFLF